MAPVTSKSTTWFNATAPTEDSTGPSIIGRVSHVMASSSQLQPVIGWMRPPEARFALVTLAPPHASANAMRKYPANSIDSVLASSLKPAQAARKLGSSPAELRDFR